MNEPAPTRESLAQFLHDDDDPAMFRTVESYLPTADSIIAFFSADAPASQSAKSQPSALTELSEEDARSLDAWSQGYVRGTEEAQQKPFDALREQVEALQGYDSGIPPYHEQGVIALHGGGFVKRDDVIALFSAKPSAPTELDRQNQRALDAALAECAPESIAQESVTPPSARIEMAREVAQEDATLLARLAPLDSSADSAPFALTDDEDLAIDRAQNILGLFANRRDNDDHWKAHYRKIAAELRALRARLRASDTAE